MSTTTIRPPGHRLDALHPLVAAGIGATTFATTMVAGDLFDLHAKEGANPGLAELGAYAGFVAVEMAIAVWLGIRARSGTPRRLSGTALGLSLVAAVAFVGFWSGLPHIFSAVAIVLALEHRRRVGSFSGPTTTALGLGAVAFVATSVICLYG